ncbi:MAG: PSD1 domain-containing protein [Planctomycetes bacterium]|nr:PSD1 domain-containing protein [Planctomycetota bacterium]
MTSLSKYVVAAALCLAPVLIHAADVPNEIVWTLPGSAVSDADLANSRSLVDEHGYESWFLMRTTNSKGPVASRTWLRDGRYAPLASPASNLFGVPLKGAIYQAQPQLAPFIAGVTETYTIDCTFKQGELMLAPGPDHAVVLGWRSPFDGLVSIHGSFNNRQTCCGANSQVNWYVERGSAPDLQNRFKPKTLAQGVSDDRINGGLSPFEMSDLEVASGDWFYFIVDARADGTGSPHHGDATAVIVSITMTGSTLPPPPEFETDIRPLLTAHCGDCHGAETREAGLDLRTVTAMIRGGESGSSLTPGKAAHSYLWTMISSGEMPPEGSEQLTRKDRSLLRRWIDAGALSKEDISDVRPKPFVTARDREHWAFRLPERPPRPEVTHPDLVETPIDELLLHRLEERGLAFSPVAPDEVLVRRLYFDLIGLPPTPAQVDAYLADKAASESPDAAWARLVDSLLDSPRYGERWGRHWMDTVGYVDVRLYDGDGTTVYPNEGMWRYRDYIIRSFNEDKPWDQFIQEQLAGDEMVDWRNEHEWPADVAEKVIATGYLRNIEDPTSEAQYGIAKRYDVLFDMMSMVSTSLLGMTFECARCHNHKYDPISQRDYYRLMASFESSFNVHNWLKPQQRWIPDVGPKARADIDQHNAGVDAQVQPLQAKISEIEKAGEAADQTADLKDQITKLNASKKSYGKIQALFDVDTSHVSRVLRRGDCLKPGLPVAPEIPEILATAAVAATNHSEPPELSLPPSTSGRRLALAKWITSRNNPMTARVIMNRLWMHHFGVPIVATPGDFGRNGARPTHPKVLDWLAVEFQDNGWSLKHMHRLVLNSRAWRQASRRMSDRAQEIDPRNTLFWRQNLNRLESEVIRDSVLTVSGRLNPEAFGPPIDVTKPVSGLSTVEPGPSGNGHNRRSVYIFARRVYPLKFMEVFDSPIMAINCTRRMNSTTVLQSFAQLNSDFVVHAARDTGDRLLKAVAAENADPIVLAFRTILGRRPNDDEQQWCERYISMQTETWQQKTQDEAKNRAMADMCQMLLCTNEFLYVE